MIPMDKAMLAASNLLRAAQTIYSVRDGLEVMRQGLDTETQTLKERREKGPNVALVQSTTGGESDGSTNPIPPSSPQSDNQEL